MLPVKQPVLAAATPGGAVMHSESNGVNGANGLNGTKNSATAPGAGSVAVPSSSVIDEILARRARTGKLVAGVAAASDSDMFKGDVSGHL